jgi:formylglycine-generating enzyme
VRELTVDSFWVDRFAVSNDDFGEFTEATGYATEAERFGWSFVFEGLLPEDFPPTQSVVQAPWWRKVDGSDWRHPEGPQSSVGERGDHPVVHISWADAQAYCTWELGCGHPAMADLDYVRQATLLLLLQDGDRIRPVGGRIVLSVARTPDKLASSATELPPFLRAQHLVRRGHDPGG